MTKIPTDVERLMWLVAESDDPQAVELHDAVVRRYDELRARDAFTRRRLELKVARDPL